MLLSEKCVAQSNEPWYFSLQSVKENSIQTAGGTAPSKHSFLLFLMGLSDFLTHDCSLSESIAVGVLGLNWKINIHYLLCRSPMVLHWYTLSQKRKVKPLRQVQERKTDEHMGAGKGHWTIGSNEHQQGKENMWNVRGWREIYGEIQIYLNN